MQTRKWQDKSGQHYTTKIILPNIRMI
ncbi:hypothetical protein [Bartonella sp. WD16.2]|nr:hypothetical protein [Bartonella sp. WD16.2]